MDPEERLKKIILKTGEVAPVLGGFEIGVINPPLFPWHQVIDQLIENGQQVWINKKEDKIYISSKPETP